MGEFLNSEKHRQALYKAESPYFSPEAKLDGIYKSHSYPFCLPRSVAEENLYSRIRQPAIAYFGQNKIKWHDGQAGKPSNHLCDSQVCCVNFLFSFASEPLALAALLKPLFPDIREMLPIEDGLYVAFEWIGAQNYLGEKVARTESRTRGANCTSADATVMFRNQDGSHQIVLIEWKYTESYSSTWLKFAPSGTDRTAIYQHLYQPDGCPLNKKLIPAFDSLFYEPFYQLMRQQFLAHEMEKAHELDADSVSLLHISPASNHDFTRVTSPDLKFLDHSATGVWTKLVRQAGKFHAEYTENLYGNFPIRQFPALRDWWRYIISRYDWV